MSSSSLPTLELALTQLEARLQAGPDSEDAREALRKLIEVWKTGEVAQGYELKLIDWLEETWLRRKGILVLGVVKAENVKAILEKNGFDGLSEVVGNGSVLDIIEAQLEAYLATNVQEIEGKIEQETARYLVEYVGLKWPEPEDTSSSTTSGSVGAT